MMRTCQRQLPLIKPKSTAPQAHETLVRVR